MFTPSDSHPIGRRSMSVRRTLVKHSPLLLLLDGIEEKRVCALAIPNLVTCHVTAGGKSPEAKCGGCADSNHAHKPDPTCDPRPGQPVMHRQPSWSPFSSLLLLRACFAQRRGCLWPNPCDSYEMVVAPRPRGRGDPAGMLSPSISPSRPVMPEHSRIGRVGPEVRGQVQVDGLLTRSQNGLSRCSEMLDESYLFLMPDCGTHLTRTADPLFASRHNTGTLTPLLSPFFTVRPPPLGIR